MNFLRIMIAVVVASWLSTICHPAFSSDETADRALRQLKESGVDVGVDEGRIWAIDITGSVQLSTVGQQSSDLADLRYLGIVNCKLRKSDLEWLSDTKALKRVTFSRCVIVGDAWSALAMRDGLEAIRITNCTVEFDGFDTFCKDSTIREFEIDGARFTDRHCDQMVKMACIESVTIANAIITDDGVVSIAHLPLIRKVVLRDVKVTDRAVEALLAAKDRIVLLALDGTRVTDNAMDVVSRCPELLALSISRTRVTDRGINALRGHKKLASLAIEHTAIGDQSIDVLKSLPAIRFCYISDSRITVAGCQRLRSELAECKIEGSNNCDPLR